MPWRRVVDAAVTAAKIATGEIEEDFGADDGKDPNAKVLGAKAALPVRVRSRNAAAAKRWGIIGIKSGIFFLTSFRQPGRFSSAK